MPRTLTKEGKNPEKIVQDKAYEILKKLPCSLNLSLAEKKFPLIKEDSMNTII